MKRKWAENQRTASRRSTAPATALLHGLMWILASFAPKSSVAAESNFIGNGLETQGFAPVVKLELTDLQGLGSSLCTGTFITPTHILTAAHCVCGFGNAFGLKVDGKVMPLLRRHIPPALGEDGCRQIAWGNMRFSGWKHDLAVIEVPPSASSRRMIYRVYSVLQKRSTPVTLVGFGFSDTDDDLTLTSGGLRTRIDLDDGWGLGRKRYGTNRIHDYQKDGEILVQGRTDVALSLAFGAIPSPDGERVAIMAGDSGGPLLTKTTVAGRTQYVIIGVASRMMTLPNSRDRLSIFASLAHPSNLEFIRKFVKTIPQ